MNTYYLFEKTMILYSIAKSVLVSLGVATYPFTLWWKAITRCQKVLAQICSTVCTSEAMAFGEQTVPNAKENQVSLLFLTIFLSLDSTIKSLSGHWGRKTRSHLSLTDSIVSSAQPWKQMFWFLLYLSQLSSQHWQWDVIVAEYQGSTRRG